MADGGGITPDPGAAPHRPGDPGISELQERLDELQRSVELLGTQGVWTSLSDTPAAPLDAPAPEAPTATTPPQAPSPAPTPPVHPPVPAAAAPPPAATNGHGDEQAGISDPEASVAMVDAGPFADLIELRHFEDDLTSLTAVRDVRVRRFGQGRAMIEVGMAGPYELSRELPRLGLPMDVATVGEGELVIEFAPVPVAPDEEAQAAPDTAAAVKGEGA